MTEEHVEKVEKVQFIDGRVEDTKTSSVKCSCYFHQTIILKLPCCHIFTLRNRLEMPMFDEERWHMACYKTIHIVFSDSETLGSFSISSVDLPHPKPKSQHQKFRAAQSICLRLASIVSESYGNDFDHKMAEPERLQSLWEVGKTNHGRTQTAK